MFWWADVPNFGDSLSPVIVAFVSGGTPVFVSRRYRAKVLSTGSIIHHLAREDIVWGSGAIQDEPITPPRGVTFRAVRGPLTRELLRTDVPDVYGDPALLLPRFYSPRPTRRFDVGVIPHFTDREWVDIGDACLSIIDVRADWRRVVTRICECDVILSSSLHGLIVAEAYGVPAVWISPKRALKGGRFKFHDYYLASHREPPDPIPLATALRDVSKHVADPPRFDGQRLLDAWPRELTFQSWH
jgi:pyruvyltransferase